MSAEDPVDELAVEAERHARTAPIVYALAGAIIGLLVARLLGGAFARKSGASAFSVIGFAFGHFVGGARSLELRLLARRKDG